MVSLKCTSYFNSIWKCSCEKGLTLIVEFVVEFKYAQFNRSKVASYICHFQSKAIAPLLYNVIFFLVIYYELVISHVCWKQWNRKVCKCSYHCTVTCKSWESISDIMSVMNWSALKSVTNAQTQFIFLCLFDIWIYWKYMALIESWNRNLQVTCKSTVLINYPKQSF